MKPYLTALVAMLAALPAAAQEALRTITDHAGYEVSYPAEPQRIVSLHDWTVTVMAYELGANLVGSTGRMSGDGSYFVRSGRELYGLTFDDIALASVHGQLDMERIASLHPDLIIGNLGDTLEYRDQLATIAPTIIFDPMNGRTAMENYRDFAGWVNRQETFDALLARYRARIDALRPEIAGAGGHPSYVAMLPNPENGSIRLFRTYGAQSQVLEDLGFRPLPVVGEVPEGRQDANFSPEIIGQMNADWIFTTHISDRGEDEAAMLAALEQIAPGATGFLDAVAAGRFHSSDRFHVYPMTFRAMDYFLDELAGLVQARN
ncbi:ABC transporter substrate-binding protein [Poseidonocella sp. HB161398]|uniref:ABC transporter substrate-binding protein n=1 Tax=Poseidonocella sp. HB161398 TaxID=2320855 RepID=UPI001108DFA7|nr:ABC transporter substrate-binding protein [Poseidonocella sp. HB161398]